MTVLENLTCSENYEDLPDCEGENIYYTEYQLKLFCFNCTDPGRICLEYYLDYDHYTNTTMEIYEERFLYKWENLDSLHDKVIKCKGESQYYKLSHNRKELSHT